MENNYDSWEPFSGEYLKAVDVKSENEKYVIKALDDTENNGRRQLTLILEHEGNTKKFGLNMSNQQTLQLSGAGCPKDLIGQVISFTKVQANNPATKQMVESLRIKPFEIKLEEPKEVDTKEAGIQEDGSM